MYESSGLSLDYPSKFFVVYRKNMSLCLWIRLVLSGRISEWAPLDHYVVSKIMSF